ncbi:MAG: Rad52/Rad22 family DNA repair protein [Blastocatellia bacterium]
MSNVIPLPKPEIAENAAPAAAPRSIRDIIADLSKPCAKERLKTRKQGKNTLTYLPWYQAVRYLDKYAAGWSYEVRDIKTLGENCVVIVRVLIPCAEGVIWREATGIEPLTVIGYGDPASNAESMALRRAAAKFGLGLYLYDKP